MGDENNSHNNQFLDRKNAVLMLGNGIFFYGFGCGKKNQVIGELCFNTAMTGYQEILTDLSYHGQIICFTMPHIGNTGANQQDWENLYQKQEKIPIAKAAIFRNKPTNQSNYRAECDFDKFLEKFNITAIYGVNTRMITRYISQNGMINAAIAYGQEKNDVEKLWKDLQAAPNMKGQELTRKVILGTKTSLNNNTGNDAGKNTDTNQNCHKKHAKPHVLILDFGCKANIVTEIEKCGIEVTVMPADSEIKQILKIDADGYMLSNGPGDPIETSKYVKSTITDIIKTKKPVYGVCLGHQLIAIALGAKAEKIKYGHHGANHPVKDIQRNTVMICSMNHGFGIDKKTLPPHIIETHISLFDGSNCGIKSKDGKIVSVQYHPEASPGPHDAKQFFDEFANAVKKNSINENKKIAVRQ